MLRALHPRSANPPEWVSDLIDEPTKCWNRQQISEHMQMPDAQVILNIPLCSRNLEDCWAWHYERNGIFSVWSAYRLLIDTKRRREAWLEGRPATSNWQAAQNQWKKLWRIKVPGKVRNFAWRLARNSVPTEAIRASRNMSDSNLCQICNGAEDTWRHALIYCTMSKCVWSLIDEEIVEHLIACNSSDARLWMVEMMESMQAADFVKVLVTLWAIWWDRSILLTNKFCLDNAFRNICLHLFDNCYLPNIIIW